MRYYIKATGSTCYDNTGLTYPIVYNPNEKNSQKFDSWVRIVMDYNATVAWENLYHYSNLPKVIVITISDRNVEFINTLKHKINDCGLGNYILVKECEDW